MYIGSNSVFYLHNHQMKRFTSARLPVGPTHKYLFVQSPISTRNDVSSYIKSIPRIARLILLDKRKHEMSKTDDPVFDTYIPSPSEYYSDDLESFISPSYYISDNVDYFICPQVYKHRFYPNTNAAPQDTIACHTSEDEEISVTVSELPNIVKENPRPATLTIILSITELYA